MKTSKADLLQKCGLTRNPRVPVFPHILLLHRNTPDGRTVFFTSLPVCLLLRSETRSCGLREPGFETGLAESCVIARNQCSLAKSRPSVKRIWIRDDFAGIFERNQAPPD